MFSNDIILKDGQKGNCLIVHHFVRVADVHVTSSPPCWWTKTKAHLLESSVRPPEVVHFSIVIGVSRGWLKTSYLKNFFHHSSIKVVLRPKKQFFFFFGFQNYVD